jgi:hypothetical protein
MYMQLQWSAAKGVWQIRERRHHVQKVSVSCDVMEINVWNECSGYVGRNLGWLHFLDTWFTNNYVRNF